MPSLASAHLVIGTKFPLINVQCVQIELVDGLFHEVAAPSKLPVRRSNNIVKSEEVVPESENA